MVLFTSLKYVNLFNIDKFNYENSNIISLYVENNEIIISIIFSELNHDLTIIKKLRNLLDYNDKSNIILSFIDKLKIKFSYDRNTDLIKINNDLIKILKFIINTNLGINNKSKLAFFSHYNKTIITNYDEIERFLI